MMSPSSRPPLIVWMWTSEGDRPSPLARVWVSRSRHDLSPLGAGLRGVRCEDLSRREASSRPVDLSCPSSHVQSVTRAFRRDVHPLSGEAVSPSSREVCDPTTLTEADSDLHRACLTRLRGASRVSHPLDASFHPRPLRPCFMPVTPLGFRFQRVSPPGSQPPLDDRAPPAVSCRWVAGVAPRCLARSLSDRGSRGLRIREIRTRQSRCYPAPGGRSSPSVHLSEVRSLESRPRASTRPPLMGLVPV
jgi:hypothetical protein